ncbi:hypothetical protein Pmani_018443 [Petrolisthes manimaculis]|uniref:Uncharacterized protein n=1 Tax=Petrolisthes manimaculis TaxID=1843537 RepID=A0AAE1PKB4_9EUCA|nr:hypothetical protein Pmani_018443 [Petrolisthes manimaculis]
MPLECPFSHGYSLALLVYRRLCVCCVVKPLECPSSHGYSMGLVGIVGIWTNESASASLSLNRYSDKSASASLLLNQYSGKSASVALYALNQPTVQQAS